MLGGALSVAFQSRHQRSLNVANRSVGVNMVRFLLYAALAFNVSTLAVTAADNGGWLIEQPRSFVRTLSFKQTVQLNSKIVTSELGFVCDQSKRSNAIGAILIPFGSKMIGAWFPF